MRRAAGALSGTQDAPASGCMYKRAGGPIDISFPDSKRQLPSPWHVLASLAIILLAAATFALFWLLPTIALMQRAPPAGEISVAPSSQTIAEGESAKVTAYSTCGNFTVLANGVKVDSGSSGQEISLSLPAGNHLITVQNGNCSASATLEVVRKQCDDGAVVGCSKDGCPGKKTCYGGIWGGCDLPQRKCTPGGKVACAYNSCSFGYATCDKCGTSLGPCLPDGQAAPLNGNSLSCN